MGFHKDFAQYMLKLLTIKYSWLSSSFYMVGQGVLKEKLTFCSLFPAFYFNGSSRKPEGGILTPQ